MRSLCIIPVFNQVKEIGALLEKCRNAKACDQYLIVDDGSDDGSSEIIANSGFPYLRIDIRKGIGHALIQGTHYAFRNKFDVIVHMAGNGKMLPAEMERLLAPIREGRADYVWGSRYLPGGCRDNTPLFRRYGIPLIMNQVPFVFTGKRVSDSTCGFRAYRLSILTEYAHGWSDPWLNGYEFEFFVMAKVLLSKYRFLEVPISMIYPASKKNYSKIIPVISWWAMLKPWIVVRLGWDARQNQKAIAET